MVTHVSDFGSNVNENLESWGKALGRSAKRRRVFDLIYSSQKRQWTGREIVTATGLDLVSVLHEAKKLSASGLLHEERDSGRNTYRKDSRVQHHKRSVVRFADSPSARNALPTKRRPAGTTNVTVRIPATRAKATQISIDEIESFKKVRRVDSSELLDDDVSESDFRDGVKRVLGELGHFADWGGEQNDLFATRLRLRGKRRTTAFAFKGPATKGVLTPAKCGKNGDQIQRLLESPATVFLFQYNRQIAPSVLTQMKTHAALHSVYSRQEIFYGIIDGHDSKRLVTAYPSAFTKRSRQAKAARLRKRR